jgi:CRISPR type I-E-associated protein CasB/Cse2
MAPTTMEAAREFVQRVQALKVGELAALRRSAGRTLAEARGMAWFYRLLDPRDRANPEVAFLVATLMGLNDRPGVGNLGESMRRLAAAHRPEAVERQFRLLLDSQSRFADGRRPGGGELAYRLRRLVKLAASKGIGFDWARLLVDLRQWMHPDRRVQRRWAESFCAPREGAAADPAAAEKGGAAHAHRDPRAPEPCPLESEPG